MANQKPRSTPSAGRSILPYPPSNDFHLRQPLPPPERTTHSNQDIVSFLLTCGLIIVFKPSSFPIFFYSEFFAANNYFESITHCVMAAL